MPEWNDEGTMTNKEKVLITRWALERKECRGLHFTTDYPHHAYDKA